MARDGETDGERLGSALGCSDGGVVEGTTDVELEIIDYKLNS